MRVSEESEARIEEELAIAKKELQEQKNKSLVGDKSLASKNEELTALVQRLKTEHEQSISTIKKQLDESNHKLEESLKAKVSFSPPCYLFLSHITSHPSFFSECKGGVDHLLDCSSQ